MTAGAGLSDILSNSYVSKLVCGVYKRETHTGRKWRKQTGRDLLSFGSVVNI